MHARRSRLALLALSFVASGCAAPEEAPLYTPYVPEEGTAERIAYDEGLTRYLGTARPTETRTLMDGTVSYAFDPADGPVCMRGAVYRTSVRDTESEDLLIFLQGGGACWSDFCLAVTGAPAGIPATDLLRDAETNPLSGWDVLYLPYCDGSLFAGDNEVDEDGDGAADRLHHGLANLSAALTMGHQHFPTPRRIVLAGSSGGAYGTILAAFLVRYVYPGVPIDVLNDAGIGLAREGDHAFLDRLIDEFGARDFLPDDCAECTADGHITGLVDYLLDRDPDVRVAAISSWYDYVISELFLMETAEEFQAALQSETTALLGDPTGIIGRDLGAVELPPNISEALSRLTLESLTTATVNGVTLDVWVRAMIARDDAAWSDLVSEPGTPPMPPMTME